MRTCHPCLMVALLAACAPGAEAPLTAAVAPTTTAYASLATAQAPLTAAEVATATDEAAPPYAAPEQPFAAPRHPDAPPDPVLSAADGTRSVAIEVVAPADDAVGYPSDTGPYLAEVARNAGHLQRCWAARVDAAPVREGVVAIHAHVGPDGLVHGQCIGEDTVEDDDVRRCVNDLLSMGRYPTSDGTVDVSFQFRLGWPRR